MRIFLKYLLAVIMVVVAVILVSFLKGRGREVKMFVDLLFIIGGIIVSLGALIYAGVGSRPRFEEWYGHSTKEPDRQVEIFLEYREAQRRHGLLMMIFGLILIALSIAVGTIYL